MTDRKPKISKNKLYQLIRNGEIEQFNDRRDDNQGLDFGGLDFRNVDLRKVNISNIDFSNCYFRGADLRGLDLRTCNLKGASMHNTKISGAYFPERISPREIELSIKYGARIRVRPSN